MRADDQVPPAVPDDGHPRPAWMRGRLVVALERLPQAAYVWDDVDDAVVWDDPDPDRFVWDAPFVGSGYSDVWCDLISCEITAGGPDQYDGYPAGYCLLTLRDPGDGRYVQRTPDGRLVYFAAGRRVAVYWLDPDDVPWWIFAGSVATWRTQLDGGVQIEAYTGTADLSRSYGRPWAAGATTDHPGTRIGKILDAVGYTGPRRLDLGDVTLSVPPTADDLPYDVARRAAASGGGIIYADADDTFLFRDRRWRDGRTDQTTIPVLTDNVCDVPGAVVGWEPQTADVDLLLAGTVRLTNAADPPLVAVAAGTTDYVDPKIVFTHLETDLWQTQVDGDALAVHIAAVRSDARMALGQFLVHLHDYRFDYWADMVDRRLGDRVRWLHTDTFTDPPRTDLYDLALVVTTLTHTIGPESWTVGLATSPAVAYTRVELWDVTALTWDDPSPLAVWR